MKYVRIGAVILFCLAIGVFGYSRYQEIQKQDPTVPVITSTIDKLYISCDYEQEELFAGLQASDERDGDLTSEIIVGSISRFQSPGTCKITYVVFDSSNQAASLTRETAFTDYRAPEFVLSQPLVFSTGKSVDLDAYIGAVDRLDGDISSLVRIYDYNVSYTGKGDYQIKAEVTNSFGDLEEAMLPVHIVDEKQRTISISLKEPLIYLEKGASFSPQQYIESISLDGVKLDSYNLEVNSGVDTASPGCYEVQYTAEAGGSTGVTWLTVIVR